MVRKKAHGCAVGLLAFSPISRFPLPILSAAQRFITIMYTLFESKTPIVRPYLLKSLFATGVVR